MSMEVTGFEEVLANLHRLNQKLRDNVLQAVMLSVQDALVVAQQLSPVRSGKLRAGNKTRAINQDGETILWALYNDVSYAPYVCLGTRKMRARDFMHPAMQYGRKRLTERLAALSRGL